MRQTRARHPSLTALLAAGAAIALSAALGGCGLLDLLGPAASSDAVFVTGVEQLNSPAVAQAGLYQPAFTFPIDAGNPPAGQAAGFFVDMATSDPERLQMRLLSGAETPPATLLRISPPSDDALLAPAGWELPTEARESLRAGQGVFWLADDTGPDCRAGVALPSGWTQPSVTLQIYVATTGDGDPVAPAGVELAHDFFYMAAIGDSVMWGNGLAESEKFSRLVAAEIARRTHRRVVLQVQAISGASIVPSPTDVICRVQCNGEIQIASTSITTQVDLLQSPAAMELVLVDGCINDIGLSVILNADTTADALAGRVQSACHDEMLKLLDRVRSAAPAAAIVVSGYFPVVSAESDLPDMAQYLLLQDVSTDLAASGTFAQLANNANLFYDFSNQAMAAAIQDADAGGNARFALADPAFGPENALFASQPLLWGLTSNRVQEAAANQGFTLYPEDPLASLRASICFRGGVLDPLTCLYASVGHPNPAGAQRYAETIIPLLEQLGIIPP